MVTNGYKDTRLKRDGLCDSFIPGRERKGALLCCPRAGGLLFGAVMFFVSFYVLVLEVGIQVVHCASWGLLNHVPY